VNIPFSLLSSYLRHSRFSKSEENFSAQVLPGLPEDRVKQEIYISQLVASKELWGRLLKLERELGVYQVSDDRIEVIDESVIWALHCSYQNLFFGEWTPFNEILSNELFPFNSPKPIVKSAATKSRILDRLLETGYFKVEKLSYNREMYGHTKCIGLTYKGVVACELMYGMPFKAIQHLPRRMFNGRVDYFKPAEVLQWVHHTRLKPVKWSVPYLKSRNFSVPPYLNKIDLEVRDFLGGDYELFWGSSDFSRLLQREIIAHSELSDIYYMADQSEVYVNLESVEHEKNVNNYTQDYFKNGGIDWKLLWQARKYDAVTGELAQLEELLEVVAPKKKILAGYGGQLMDAFWGHGSSEMD
jgi:hypothetical protein